MRWDCDYIGKVFATIFVIFLLCSIKKIYIYIYIFTHNSLTNNYLLVQILDDCVIYELGSVIYL